MNSGELAPFDQPLHCARVDVKQLCRLRCRQQRRSRLCGRGCLDGLRRGATGDDTGTRLRQDVFWRDVLLVALAGIELEQWKRELTGWNLHHRVSNLSITGVVVNTGVESRR